MKKGMKGFLIGAGICILIGVIMVVISLCAGGFSQTKEIMDNGGITVSFSPFKSDRTTGTERTVSLDGSSTPSLALDLEAGSFELVEGDCEDIEIISQKGVDVEKNGDLITISNANHHVFFHIGNSGRSNDVTIRIPKGVTFETVEAEIGAGELTCERLDCSNLDVELGAGQVTIKKADCGECTMVVGAGQIVVEEGNMDDLDVEVGMGSFTIHGNVKQDLDADCGMGTIQMWLGGSQKDHNYEIECGMGEINVGDQFFGGMSTSQSIHNEASSDFDLECGMGSIEIFFEN